MDQVWLEYQEKIFTKALRDADQLARVPADEREPYKSRSGDRDLQLLQAILAASCILVVSLNEAP